MDKSYGHGSYREQIVKVLAVYSVNEAELKGEKSAPIEQPHTEYKACFKILIPETDLWLMNSRWFHQC